MNFKRLLSYILPVNIYQTPSVINTNLEVTWNNGQLVLDSKNTNFSFGSLERVMRKGLKFIGKGKISTYKSALVLGVGGGSAIKLLQNEFDFNGKITGIELDENIIEIANRFFNLKSKENFEIHIEDAFEFVNNTNLKYDLIIIDIFQDNIMPSFLFSETFNKRLSQILSENGSILFNSIVTLSDDSLRNKNYLNLVRSLFSKVVVHSKIEGNNELFILKK